MPLTDVFLSYSHRDEPAVLRLTDALRKADLSVWIDTASVEVFDNIENRVASGIAGSKLLLSWYSIPYANPDLANGSLQPVGKPIMANASLP